MKSKQTFCLVDPCGKYAAGIAELQRAGDWTFTIDTEGIPIQIVSGDGYCVRYDGRAITISAERAPQVFRAVEILTQANFDTPFCYRYNTTVKNLGLMVDCSRNAVMHVAAVKRLLRLMARMGYGHLQLYTEDTYALEGEPYFGYMRGRYSKEELRTIVAYADTFGIEVIPCIQTLAHLQRIFKWSDYKPINDVGDILLVGDEKTYALIEKMFAALRDCFHGDVVNIGMDEAHLLGRGNYLDRNGYRERFELLTAHLRTVADIAARHGFKPIMWSDMFFRIAAKDGIDYYNDDPLLEDTADKIPAGVAPVYWDYYHTDKDTYVRMIKRHKAIGAGKWFAGGAWKWRGVVPLNGFGMAATAAAVEACLEQGVENVFMTAWGDGGGECSVFAVLPTLCFAAEACYGGDRFEAFFEGLTGVRYDDFIRLDLPNVFDGKDKGVANPSRMLLYNDPLIGLYDKAVPACAEAQLRAHSAQLTEARERATEYAYLFDTEIALTRLLACKAESGLLTRKYYREKDVASMRTLLDERYRKLPGLIDAFYRAFRTQWMNDNKPFGFEIQDLRLGGLKQRIEHCAERLRAWAAGEVDCIEELEQEILYYDPESQDRDITVYGYADFTVHQI